MTLSEQQTVGSEIFEAGVGHLPGSVEIVRVIEHLADESKAERAGDRVIDVTRLHGHEAVEKLRGARQAVTPALMRLGIEQ